jgi:pyrophosphatase PpaX
LQVKGIIFDLDGTLADTLPVCIRALQHVIAQYRGQQYTDAEVRATFGPTEEGVLRNLMPDCWPEALNTYLLAYEKDHLGCTEPFPGMRDALELLAERHIKLAVVTGKGPGSAEISMRYLGLRAYFDRIEAGSADGPIKPQSIEFVLNAWGEQPQHVAYVGDTNYDMRAARQAGLLPIGAAWAKTATVQIQPAGDAHLVFSTVRDFIDWIDETVTPTGSAHWPPA